jgi:hypothetical protein
VNQGICGRKFSTGDRTCSRPKGHLGRHWEGNARSLRWGDNECADPSEVARILIKGAIDSYLDDIADRAETPDSDDLSENIVTHLKRSGVML